MSNKIWVLTYTIGTNEGRRERRQICNTKESAIAQQGVLGGEISEYVESPKVLKVKWPETMDVDAIMEEMRKTMNDPATWKDLYQCRAEPETESERVCNNEAVKDLVVDEIACLIDDMSNHSPGCQWQEPGSPEWDCAKVEALNNIRKLLNAIR